MLPTVETEFAGQFVQLVAELAANILEYVPTRQKKYIY